jgi:4-hydroxymandelate oxidase
VSIDDLEALARSRLDAATWEYIAGGSEDELTLRACRSAFRAYELRPRVLRGVASPDIGTTVLGAPLSLPIVCAPVAYLRLAHADGELGACRAAASMGTLAVLSAMASTRIEDVAALDVPWWVQLYIFRDRSLTRALVERAVAGRCGAIVLTVDSPRLGRRERDLRNAFVLPSGVAAVNLAPLEGPTLAAQMEAVVDPCVGWDAVAWLRSLTDRPIVLKGILTAEDARLAVDSGAAAIVVSNHGGRQLDGAVPSLEALPEIAEAVCGRCEIYVDGGVRRGIDVVKAIALGARAVWIGRPYVWGLAVGGEVGVAQALETMRRELKTALALLGQSSLGALDASVLRRIGRGPDLER